MYFIIVIINIVDTTEHCTHRKCNQIIKLSSSIDRNNLNELIACVLVYIERAL